VTGDVAGDKEGAVRARVLATTTGAATALLVAGIAYAVIPDANGVIHGCYAKDGSLRVSDSGCKKSETALDWNQSGPTGAAGPPGPPGSGVSGTGEVFAGHSAAAPQVFDHSPTDSELQPLLNPVLSIPGLGTVKAECFSAPYPDYDPSQWFPYVFVVNDSGAAIDVISPSDTNVRVQAGDRLQISPAALAHVFVLASTSAPGTMATVTLVYEVVPEAALPDGKCVFSAQALKTT
jgi:hypothetical protein